VNLQNRYVRLRLRHMRLLDVLERTSSMSQAAEELRVTQSAATKVLQDVEQMFEVELFSRSPRGLAPTYVGRHVVQYARRMLSETEMVIQNVDTMKAGGAGSLSVGAIMAAMPGVLPAALVELRRLRPLLTVHLTAATSDEILAMLEQRKLEVGICRLVHDRQQLLFDLEELFQEDSWVVAGKDHSMARANQVEIAELKHLPWVMQPWPAPSRQLLEATFAKAGVRIPPVRIETASRFATLNLIQHAGMVGMLAKPIVDEPVSRGDMVRLPIVLPGALPDFGVVTRRNELPSEHALEFVAIVRAMAGAAIRSP
jgi:DNA-binding transcriptional LysR family regulator